MAAPAPELMIPVVAPDPEMGSNMARRTGREFDLDQMKPSHFQSVSSWSELRLLLRRGECYFRLIESLCEASRIQDAAARDEHVGALELVLKIEQNIEHGRLRVHIERRNSLAADDDIRPRREATRDREPRVEARVGIREDSNDTCATC